MTKKIFILLVVSLVSIILFSACGQKGIETKTIGDIKIEIVEPDSLKEDLKKWYKEAYKEKFSHSVSYIDGYKYVLISAGEMPTAGYEIDLLDAQKEDDVIIFYAKLLAPDKGEMTAQVITYPHVLFRVKEKDEVSIRAELDMGGIESEQGGSNQYQGLQGVYIGLVDSNSIEIDVDSSYDFPGNGGPVVFKLADAVKTYFIKDNSEYKGFKNNDLVEFDCVKAAEGLWEVTEIANISNGLHEESIIGEYVGQADANSVEITIEDKPEIFRLSDHIKADIEINTIETGTKVRIKYTQEAGVRIITDIEVVTS